MAAKLTNALLKRAHNAAVKHSELNTKLTAAFNERYGCTYSDVDADGLIDALDYGLGNQPTVEECDRDMSEMGRAPLSERTTAAEKTPTP